MACNEAIESIIAEMREFADTDSQSIGRDVLRRKIQHFSDRIELAHRAEIDWLIVREDKRGNMLIIGRFGIKADADEYLKIITPENAEMGYKTYIKKVLKGEGLWSK